VGGPWAAPGLPWGVAALGGRRPLARGRLELALVAQRGAGGGVGGGAGAVRRRAAARVARGHADPQPAGGADPVLGREFQAERVSGPAVQHVPELDRVGRLRGRLPARPAGQAVNGVAPRGLAQVKLVAGALEGVPAAVNPVRPRGEQLARGSWRELIRPIFGDNGPITISEFAKAGAEFGDRCGVVAGGYPELRSGERDRGQLGHAAHRCFLGGLVPTGLLGERGTFSPAGSLHDSGPGRAAVRTSPTTRGSSEVRGGSRDRSTTITH